MNRIYKNKPSELGIVIDKAYADADRGRVAVALQQLDELEQEFPGHAKIAYARGLVYREYLGQGIEARRWFAEAYERDRRHAFAVENATFLSRNEAEFREWAEIMRKVVSRRDPSHKSVKEMLSHLDQGHSYVAVLDAQINAKSSHQSATHGSLAALLELCRYAAAEAAAQQGQNVTEQEELKLRRNRAWRLRQLDHAAASQHPYQKPPAEERLALEGALEELQAVLKLSAGKFDPEVWNSAAAYLTDLRRYSEAIDAADESMRLRPNAYPKPHQNKAVALGETGRFGEAVQEAREAERQAQAAGDAADLKAAQVALSRYSEGRPAAPALQSRFEETTQAMIQACRRQMDLEVRQYMGFGSVMINGTYNRAAANRGLRSIAYVMYTAEILAAFSPETAFMLIENMKSHSREVYDRTIEAVVYLAAHAEGVEQRDAVRVLMLVIHEPVMLSSVRNRYRHLVMEPMAAADAESPFQMLGPRMEEEFSRLDGEVSGLVARQDPVDADGRRRGTELLEQLRGDPVAENSPADRNKSLVLQRVIAGTLVATVVAWLIFGPLYYWLCVSERGEEMSAGETAQLGLLVTSSGLLVGMACFVALYAGCWLPMFRRLLSGPVLTVTAGTAVGLHAYWLPNLVSRFPQLDVTWRSAPLRVVVGGLIAAFASQVIRQMAHDIRVKVSSSRTTTPRFMNVPGVDVGGQTQVSSHRVIAVLLWQSMWGVQVAWWLMLGPIGAACAISDLPEDAWLKGAFAAVASNVVFLGGVPALIAVFLMQGGYSTGNWFLRERMPVLVGAICGGAIAWWLPTMTQWAIELPMEWRSGVWRVVVGVLLSIWSLSLQKTWVATNLQRIQQSQAPMG